MKNKKWVVTWAMEMWQVQEGILISCLAVCNELANKGEEWVEIIVTHRSIK